MSKFDDIKELLSNAFPKFPNILQIELRAEFSVIDYKGQSFILSLSVLISMIIHLF